MADTYGYKGPLLSFFYHHQVDLISSQQHNRYIILDPIDAKFCCHTY